MKSWANLLGMMLLTCMMSGCIIHDNVKKEPFIQNDKVNDNSEFVIKPSTSVYKIKITTGSCDGYYLNDYSWDIPATILDGNKVVIDGNEYLLKRCRQSEFMENHYREECDKINSKLKKADSTVEIMGGILVVLLLYILLALDNKKREDK